MENLCARKKHTWQIFLCLLPTAYERLEYLMITHHPIIFRVIKSRRISWARHVTRLGERRGVKRVFLWKSEGKRPFGRTRRKWDDNIKIDLQEVGCVVRDWIELAQNRDK
jgi:hypothetical protein